MKCKELRQHNINEILERLDHNDLLDQQVIQVQPDLLEQTELTELTEQMVLIEYEQQVLKVFNECLEQIEQIEQIELD
jgi:hypothetical protein